MKMHGIVGRFSGPEAVVEAARKVRLAGYEQVDIYSPFPIHGSDPALGLSRSKLPWMVLVGGFTGAATGYFGQQYLNTVDYPIWTGGKPFGSWQPLMPVTFELMILFSAFTTVLGMLWLNGLPRLSHPIFSYADFSRVSGDGFFLAIEASDARFDPTETANLLEKLGGQNIQLLEEA